jgi:mRNA-degrading endonuclease RelE of RelBE toxin-antitoxin system
MAYKVLFHPLASKEFSDAYSWYEARLSGLGNRFENLLYERIRSISESPLTFPKKLKAYHEAKIDSFPYLIVYKVYPKKKIVFVTAVYHTSRNPRKKYRR